MLSAPGCLRQRLVQSCRSQRITGLLHSCEALHPHLSRLFALHKRYETTKSTRVDGQSNGSLSNVSPVKRQQLLKEEGFLEYPRADSNAPTSIASFTNDWKDQLKPGEAVQTEDVTVVGRILALRTAGSKLLFVDITDDGKTTVQVVLEKSKLQSAETTENVVKKFGKLVQRGDTISVSGNPYSTTSGELSIRANGLPRILSPCLHQIPASSFGDDSDYAHDRHVQMLADPSIIDIVKARDHITSGMHAFFRRQGFVNVQTPILAAAAGGAIARPFETSATEFSDRKLALRIAPELWLKRLIIGGMQKVYELGPSFRNEGLDKTHNPEFTTCEFYAVNWNLQKLMHETQQMVYSITSFLPSLHQSFNDSIACNGSRWPEIDFIPALNEALDLELPDLSSSSAREQVLNIFETKSLPTPSTPTLPRLLDKLSSVYLEPQCDKATWIVNTPECLSPLAKSFNHPTLPNQRVAARAELFILQKEVVNCYEEENSPIEQRRKFIDQQKHASLNDQKVDDEAMKVDEDYIRALEWGLPPTGGWGCGVDRLCMLMLGKEKISDVLTFGNLRMVTRGAEKWIKEESKEE